jgi:hypothetical protein
MAAYLGLALVGRKIAPQQSEDLTPWDGDATNNLANVMSDFELNNMVRAIQDAVTYPIRTRSSRRAQRRPLPSNQPSPNLDKPKIKRRG